MTEERVTETGKKQAAEQVGDDAIHHETSHDRIDRDVACFGPADIRPDLSDIEDELDNIKKDLTDKVQSISAKISANVSHSYNRIEALIREGDHVIRKLIRENETLQKELDKSKEQESVYQMQIEGLRDSKDEYYKQITTLLDEKRNLLKQSQIRKELLICFIIVTIALLGFFSHDHYQYFKYRHQFNAITESDNSVFYKSWMEHKAFNEIVVDLKTDKLCIIDEKPDSIIVSGSQAIGIQFVNQIEPGIYLETSAYWNQKMMIITEDAAGGLYHVEIRCYNHKHEDIDSIYFDMVRPKDSSYKLLSTDVTVACIVENGAITVKDISGDDEIERIYSTSDFTGTYLKIADVE